MLVTVGKERALKMLYGIVSDEINKFKIGDGDDSITATTTDLESPISYGGGELQDIDGTAYYSGTTMLEATCIVSTTDYTGNVSEFGIFTASGTMIYGETFSTYYKDGNTNLKIKAQDRHL
jgi:hypothetical protein